MKCSLFTFCFFFMISLCNAQQRKIDSIQKLINSATSDTQRINRVNAKIDVWSNVNYDSAIALARSNAEDARRIGYKKGEGYALLKISASSSFKGYYDTAASVLIEANKIFSGLHDSAGQSRTYSSFGMMYGMQSKYDSSIIFYSKAIKIAEKLKDKKYLGTCYQNIAIDYIMQSNFPVALDYQQRSLSIAKELDNESGVAFVTLNMGITYKNMGDTTKSTNAFLEAAEIARRNHLLSVEMYAYSNLANTYLETVKNDSSYIYGMKAVELSKKTGDIGMHATSLGTVATALANDKKFDEAEKLSKESLGLADSSSQPLNTLQTYGTMGYILKLQQKYRQAIPFYEKALSVLKKSDIYDVQVRNYYNQLSECYEKTGNSTKALAAFKLSAKISDSIRSKENIRKATELSMNYDFEKKQEVQKARQKMKDDIAHSKQTVLWIGLAIFLLLAIAGFIGFKNKQKANGLLKKQKEEIESTLGKLKSAQAQLIQSEKMASLGELTAGIAHEIQNPLNFVNNFSEVNKEILEELLVLQQMPLAERNEKSENEIVKDVIENEKKIIHHGKRADAIVKGMLQHSRSHEGEKQKTDINALTDEYLRLSYHGLRARDKSFNSVPIAIGIKTSFDNTLEKINIIPSDIGRVLLNLFNNAFYAVYKKQQSFKNNLIDENELPGYQPTVFVSTRKITDASGNARIEITTRDNGNGIPDSVIGKVFQPFFTTKPTGEGTGLGLSLSYDIVKAHGGEIKARNRDEGGAEFILELPIS